MSLVLAAAALAVAAPAAEAAKPTASIEGRTLTVTGTARADAFALRIDPEASNRLDVDVGDDGTADFSFAQETFKRIGVEAGDGSDRVRIDDGNGAFTTVKPTTIDGEGGRDTLTGGAGVEHLDGGDGGDTVDGNGGDDSIDLGAGPYDFVWDPGDGSDSIRGGDGKDQVTANGSDDREKFRLVPKGDHARLTRDLDSVGMSLREVEHVVARPLGNNDSLTVGDLTGTGVTTVTHDGSLDGGVPELSFDTTTVKGTDGDDAIDVRGRDGHAKVTGLPATVELHHADPLRDTLAIKARRGRDNLDAAKLHRSAVKLSADGGGDEDTVLGGGGDDALFGGGGEDVIIGGAGKDTADGGAGRDTALLSGGADHFVWNPGDGDDVVEGEAGQDALTFNGTNAGERINVSANGGRLRLTRNIGHITLDANGFESVDVVPFAGPDRVFVHDLTTTDVRSVDADLGITFGLDTDGDPDEVTVDGTEHADVVSIFGSNPLLDNPSASITSGGPFVLIDNTDGTLDHLTYRARGGDDTVIATGVEPDSIGLQLDGGDGEDHLDGGDEDDTIFGGPKDDVLTGGPGNDTIIGGPGNDTVFQ
jgi:Ca2+-binding RTX toxin-like protein